MVEEIRPIAEHLLDEDTKVLIRAGFLDEQLRLTSYFKEVLIETLFKEKKDLFVKKAKAKLEKEVTNKTEEE